MLFRLRTCIKTAEPARLASSPLFLKSILTDGLLLRSVKFGTLSQTPDQVLANLKSALPAIIAAVHGGWDNVQSLSIKTSKSASLPIWTCKLGNDEGARWHGLTLEAEDSEESEDDEVSNEETPRTTKPAKAAQQPPVQGGKKQKRTAEVAEPPAQKKRKTAREPTTDVEPLTTPKPRKGSKARLCSGVEPCH